MEFGTNAAKKVFGRFLVLLLSQKENLTSWTPLQHVARTPTNVCCGCAIDFTMRPQKTNSINPEWNITSFNMQVILIWSPSHHIMNMWWLCYHHAFIQTLGKNTTTRLSFFGQRMITWWKATPMQRKCIESIGKSTDHPSISSMLQHVATTQTNVRYDTMKRWYDTMIRWYDECDTMILCYSDTMIRWCDDTMILW